MTGFVYKEYETERIRTIDWGVGVKGRLNTGKISNFNLIEGYGKVRISSIELRAGRTHEITGLCDTSLSAGSFSISGNAPGIPKVQIGLTKFISLPVFNELLAFKSNLAHGWLGYVRVADKMDQVKTWFHQKSLYLRAGQPEWKWKLYWGINHQVFWGNEKTIFGSDYRLSDAQTYLYVFTGRDYGTSEIDPSRVGNHLGSLDIGFEYEFKNWRIFLYRQNFYDFIALSHLANIPDGLNGISITNKSHSGVFRLNKLLFEIFNSADQGAGFTPVENYYNNYIYTEGWSYKGIGLGNPFITQATYMRNGAPADNVNYFINNRVTAFNLGINGSIESWEYVIRMSYSLNYGNYHSETQGQRNQFSSLVEFMRELKHGLDVGLSAAFDVGELYYNSMGFQARISRSF